MSEQVGNSTGSKDTSRLFGGHRFAKGVSGNPSGRPKKQLDLAELAKNHTREAVETLVEVMRKAPRHADRAGAAIAILDRGWGRPAQMILGDPNRPVSIDFRWADDTPVQPGAQQPAQQLVLEATAVAWDEEASPAPGNEESK